MWPMGAENSESPPRLGFPRNIRIRDVEDRLLALAIKLGIDLQPVRSKPAELEMEVAEGKWSFVAFADGPASKHRQHFRRAFGQADHLPYSLPEEPEKSLEDTVLAIRVRCKMPDPDTCVLTIAQNRFLLNATEGDGYLYMRLTRDEVIEVRGRSAKGKQFTGCIQSQPCEMELEEERDDEYSCTTHQTTFIPATDPNSFLWPRVMDGMRLFDCEPRAVTVFRLSMEARPRFTGELTPTGTAPPVFGALLGDCANAIHFWPGRGLNHAIYTAVALARSLHRVGAIAASRPADSRLSGPLIRAADLAQFEGALAALQMRHKDRAWRAMVQKDTHDGPNGKPRAVADIISDSINDSDEAERPRYVERLEGRIRGIASRLDSRLPAKPTADRIVERLPLCTAETLAVLARSGPWETFLSGGREVDVDYTVPVYQADESPAFDLTSSVLLTRTTGNALPFKDVLEDGSVRVSFKHACDFAGRNTLACSAAEREIRALLVRADFKRKVSDEEIAEAVEKADTDGSFRIDESEFLAAVRTISEKRDRGVKSLQDFWSATFRNAAEDPTGSISCRLAARLIYGQAQKLNPVRQDLCDPGKLQAEFQQRCTPGIDAVDLATYLEVAAKVMTGED